MIVRFTLLSLVFTTKHIVLLSYQFITMFHCELPGFQCCRILDTWLIRTNSDIDRLWGTLIFNWIVTTVVCIPWSFSTYLFRGLYSISCEETEAIVLKYPEFDEHDASTIMAMEQTDLSRELVIRLVILMCETFHFNHPSALFYKFRGRSGLKIIGQFSHDNLFDNITHNTGVK